MIALIWEVVLGLLAIALYVIGLWLGLHDGEWARGAFYLLVAGMPLTRRK